MWKKIFCTGPWKINVYRIVFLYVYIYQPQVSKNHIAHMGIVWLCIGHTGTGAAALRGTRLTAAIPWRVIG